MARKMDLSPTEVSIYEEVGASIVEKMAAEFIEVEGAPLATVKYKDGSFKRKPIMGGWNFSFEYAYVGARGLIIFGLSPEDSQEYEYAEFPVKDIDKMFPLAGKAVADHFGIKTENFEVLVNQLITRFAEIRLAAEKEADKAYQDNPMFGLF